MTQELRPAYYQHGQYEPWKFFQRHGEDNYYLCTAIAYLGRKDKNPNDWEKDLQKAHTCYAEYKRLYPHRYSPLQDIKLKEFNELVKAWQCDADMLMNYITGEENPLSVVR